MAGSLADSAKVRHAGGLAVQAAGGSVGAVGSALATEQERARDPRIEPCLQRANEPVRDHVDAHAIGENGEPFIGVPQPLP